jgi:hypothetical protein
MFCLPTWYYFLHPSVTTRTYEGTVSSCTLVCSTELSWSGCRVCVLAGVDAAAAGLRGLGQLPAPQAARGQAGHGPSHRPPERGDPRPAHRDNL